MICLMCLEAETPSEDQVCDECMQSLKYAEDFITQTGLGLRVTFVNSVMMPSMKRGDLEELPIETEQWVAEVTAQQDPTGEIDQPVYTGKADNLKEACDLAFEKLKEDLE